MRRVCKVCFELIDVYRIDTGETVPPDGHQPLPSADERLATVLAEHEAVIGYDGEAEECKCGLGSARDDDLGWDRHRAHLAAALRDAGWVDQDTFARAVDDSYRRGIERGLAGD